MKKLLALALCLLLLAGCAAPAAYNGPTESVWVLAERVTTYPSDEYGPEEQSRTTYAYDTFGNQVRTLSWQDGELSSERKYAYDDRGNVTALAIWDHSGLIAWPSSRTGYTYDEQNRPTATIYRNFLGLERRRDTYTYDDAEHTVLWEGAYDTQTTWLNENGNPVRTLTYSEPADIWMETRYEYDDQGRNTRILSYYDEVLSSTATLVYDDQDRILEETYCDSTGAVYSRRTYHYGENTVTTYDLDGSKTVETYRPDGQVEKMEQYRKNGELSHTTVYTYQKIQVPADREE